MNTMKIRYASAAFMTVYCLLFNITIQWRLLCTDAVDAKSEDVCGSSPPCRDGCYLDSDNASNDGDCVIVPAGHYSPEGEDTLKKCPEGTFMTQEGAEICNACPVGTAAPEKGSLVCDPCDEGLYASTPGSTICNMCNPGIYFGPGSVGVIRENGIDYCAEPTPKPPSPHNCDGFSSTPCSGGCYVAGNSSIAVNATRVCIIVPNGFYSPTGDDLLYMCPAGYYALEGSSECTPCAAGSASGVAGSGWCQLCPPSTYASNKGSLSCSSCDSKVYFGPGSDAAFVDDQSNILYCQKPSKGALENPTSAPSRVATSNPSTEPSLHERSPTAAPVVTLEPPTTNAPTTIFDLVSEHSRPPRNSGAPQPTSVHNPSNIDNSTNRGDYPLFWILSPMMVGAILATAVAVFLFRRFRWLIWRRRETRIVPPVPQDDWLRQTANPSSPPIPKVISMEYSMDDDDASLSGLFLDDDLFTV